jgi:hypothetical protein
MRLFVVVLVVVACDVPDKQAPGDGDVDGPGSAGPTGPFDTMITSQPPAFSNMAEARFEFTSNIATAQFMCSIDGGTPAACSSPFMTSLPDGTHTFSVRAGNGKGDEDDSPAEAVWTIDTVAPDTTITSGPAAYDNSKMVMLTFTSNEMNVTFDCSLDGADFQACNSGDTFGPLGNGAHSFAVRAKDRAGNIDPSPAVHAWITDTSTPDTEILSGPTGTTASTTATFTFDSPNAGPAVYFTCSLDSSFFVLCFSPVTINNLGEGSHTFQVRVHTLAGNVDPTPATRTWVVDLTSPVSLNLSAGPHSFAVSATDGAGNTATASRMWTVACAAPGATGAAGQLHLDVPTQVQPNAAI